MSQEQKMENKSTPTSFIHSLLAKSYSVYLVGFIVGVLLDAAFPVSIMQNGAPLVGVFIMLLGTALIFWSQKTSKRTAHARNNPNTQHDVSYFYKGPYKIFRSPTHVGLALLLASYGFLANSLVIIIVTVIVYILVKIFFVSKQDKMLEDKYGDTYRQYKKKVRI